jgi:hypothetical protein
MNKKKIIIKTNLGTTKKRKQICNIQDKYEKENIYMKIIISVMFMKKIQYKFGFFFVVQEFVLNTSKQFRE